MRQAGDGAETISKLILFEPLYPGALQPLPHAMFKIANPFSLLLLHSCSYFRGVPQRFSSMSLVKSKEFELAKLPNEYCSDIDSSRQAFAMVAQGIKCQLGHDELVLSSFFDKLHNRCDKGRQSLCAMPLQQEIPERGS